jgi:hypothetical protein
MVDYWLAGYFGRAWLWLRKGLRPRLNDLTGLSQMVARGEPLPASQLWQAQDFAVRVWWRFGMASVLSMVVVGIIAKAVAHGLVLDVAVGVVATLACLMAVAGAQVKVAAEAERTFGIDLTPPLPPRHQPLRGGDGGHVAGEQFWPTKITVRG